MHYIWKNAAKHQKYNIPCKAKPLRSTKCLESTAKFFMVAATCSPLPWVRI